MLKFRRRNKLFLAAIALCVGLLTVAAYKGKLCTFIRKNFTESSLAGTVCQLPVVYCEDAMLTTLTGVTPSTSDEVEFPFNDVKYDSAYASVYTGGSWKPKSCTNRQTVAIIIPFRDRRQHLHAFVKHIHPFLQHQLLDYIIIVVEQEAGLPFNRAMLLNVGFTETLKLARTDHRQIDCFIFHDVDLLPQNYRNMYSCTSNPLHLSSAVDTMLYRIPYEGIFGGVVAVSRTHFQLINGFSNKFFGWGGEDDDLYNRIRHHNLNVTRTPVTIGRYRMMPHRKEYPSSARHGTLETGSLRYHTDGLNNLRYQLLAFNQFKLYTHLLVRIRQT